MLSYGPSFMRKGLLAAALGGLLIGCAGLGGGSDYRDPPDIPSTALLTSVPFHVQKAYQCGPAALAMVLHWGGINITPDQLATAVFIPGRKGSLQSGMVSAARRYGKLAYPLKGLYCVLQEVAAGRPVIVLQNLALNWFPRWHYAVVVGYDMDDHVIVLHTSETAARRVSLKTFLHTWERADHWGLLAVPVDQMPKCAEETTYLKAALGLQIAGYSGSAVHAFRNAVLHWPQSVEANTALGNALYLDGSTQKAIQSFSRAIELDPRNGDALNNLAHLIAETGELEKAETLVLRAIDIGGPHMDIYRQTLKKIRLMNR